MLDVEKVALKAAMRGGKQVAEKEVKWVDAKVELKGSMRADEKAAR